jgi:hypothetical protein
MLYSASKLVPLYMANLEPQYSGFSTNFGALVLSKKDTIRAKG